MTVRHIQRILLPIDDSPGTEAAIEYAVVLAQALQASITLAHVDELPKAIVSIVPGASPEEDLAAERRDSRHRLDEIVADLAAKGFTQVSTLALTGASVSRTLVDIARSGSFDLIVMGTHARTGVSRLLQGSVAEEVLRHASCPVVTVHLPAVP
jgi:nucleotide-binding universal stress UspA family protein